MADRDLRNLLEPLGGDDPSPEVVDTIWRRLDTELTDDAPSVVGGPGELQMVKLDERVVEPEARSRRLWMAGGVAAAVVLAVIGLLVVLQDDGDGAVRTVDEPSSTTESPPATTEAAPPPTSTIVAAAPGPVEQLLTIYFAEGVEAAAASGLAAPGLVYGPGGEDDPTSTWFTGLAGYFVDPDLELECVSRGTSNEVCLVEAQVPLSRIVGRRGQVLLNGFVDARGLVRHIHAWDNSESATLGAYDEWLADTHPEVVESCGELFACIFTDELLDEFAASEDFVDPGPAELTLP